MTRARVIAEWGEHGVRMAHERGAAIIIIVDVLSFSTCVDVAIGRGAEIIPFPYGDHDAARLEAERVGARLAYPRDAGAQLSLSPVSLATLSAGERVLLPSPNGSKLSHLARADNAHVLCGSLRNASAVAQTARVLATGGVIAVVPAGERWPDGTLRPAIEDLLGAGMIIDGIADDNCSAEALLMRGAARAHRADLAVLIRDSVSGRELIDRGYTGDVEMALAVEVSTAVPQLRDGAYRAM